MLQQVHNNTTIDRIIFVNIGVPFSKIPIMQRVMIYVDLEVETDIRAAKKLRLQVAKNIESYGWVKGTEFKPSELYYEVYETVDAKYPIHGSPNSPFFNQAC